MTTIEINNKTIEQFLCKQAAKNNISTVEYLTNLILNEMEVLSVKQDMKTLESEIKKVNQGKIKLKSAHSLLDEL